MTAENVEVKPASAKLTATGAMIPKGSPYKPQTKIRKIQKKPVSGSNMALDKIGTVNGLVDETNSTGSDMVSVETPGFKVKTEKSLTENISEIRAGYIGTMSGINASTLLV